MIVIDDRNGMFFCIDRGTLSQYVASHSKVLGRRKQSAYAVSCRLYNYS